MSFPSFLRGQAPDLYEKVRTKLHWVVVSDQDLRDEVSKGLSAVLAVNPAQPGSGLVEAQRQARNAANELDDLEPGVPLPRPRLKRLGGLLRELLAGLDTEVTEPIRQLCLAAEDAVAEPWPFNHPHVDQTLDAVETVASLLDRDCASVLHVRAIDAFLRSHAPENPGAGICFIDETQWISFRASVIRLLRQEAQARNQLWLCQGADGAPARFIVRLVAWAWLWLQAGARHEYAAGFMRLSMAKHPEQDAETLEALSTAISSMTRDERARLAPDPSIADLIQRRETSFTVSILQEDARHSVAARSGSWKLRAVLRDADLAAAQRLDRYLAEGAFPLRRQLALWSKSSFFLLKLGDQQDEPSVSSRDAMRLGFKERLAHADALYPRNFDIAYWAAAIESTFPEGADTSRVRNHYRYHLFGRQFLTLVDNFLRPLKVEADLLKDSLRCLYCGPMRRDTDVDVRSLAMQWLLHLQASPTGCGQWFRQHVWLPAVNAVQAPAEAQT